MTKAQSFKYIQHLSLQENVLGFFIVLIFVGFISSRVLISMGVFGVFLYGFYQFSILRNKEKKAVLLLPVLCFCLLLLSFFQSEDKQMWWSWLVIKLPFLLLPMSFFLMNDFRVAFITGLFKMFVLIMCISAFVVAIRYALHYEQINESLLSGGKIPVPYSHIRYSLLLTTAFFFSIWLSMHESMKRLSMLTSGWLFIMIHLVSVRSGLLALYAGIVFFLLYLIFVKNLWKYAITALVLIISLGFIGFKTIPSLQNRISFMRYDWSQWQSGNIDGNSDAMRMASIVSGYELWKQHFWLGVGSGDILAESKETEKALFTNIKDEKSYKMPHNEFLWTACTTGLLGLIVFLLAWLYPFYFFRNEINWLFIVLQLIFFVSFLVEYTLEEQIGGTFFVLFQLLFFKWFITERWRQYQL